MTKPRRERIPQILLGQLVVALVILVAATCLVFYAQGWRFNFKTFQIYKTGLLYFEVSPTPDSFTIGNKNYEGKSKFAINLLPGTYQAKAVKNGYGDWNMEVSIEPEMVTSFSNIVLFANNPKITTLSDQSKIACLNSPDSNLAEKSQKDLSSNKYEIWSEGKLVTRFSQPISNVVWYPDLEHILFQQNDQIRVIDSQGFNNALLVTLSINQPTRFAVGNQGKELYYIDNNQYFMAIIR